MPLPILSTSLIVGPAGAFLTDGSFITQSTVIPASSPGSTLVLFFDVRPLNTTPAGFNTSSDTPVVSDNQGNSWTILATGDTTGSFQPTVGIAICKNAIANTATITVQHTARVEAGATGGHFSIDMAVVEVGSATPTVIFDVESTSLPQRCISPSGAPCATAPMASTLVDSTGANYDVVYCNVGSDRAAALLDIYDSVGSDTWFIYQCGFFGSEASGFFPTPPGPDYIDTVISSTTTFSSVFTSPSSGPNALIALSENPASPPSIICDSPPSGTVGVAYTHTFPASGGTPPYTFSIVSGSLPTGLTLDSATGIVSGIPTVAGTFSFIVQVTDAGAQTSSVNCSISILQPLGASCNNPQSGVVGMPYEHTFTASGGTGPYTFAITAGALPTGLAMNSAGMVSGTPSVSGTFTFTVTATDSLSATASVVCSISIIARPAVNGFWALVNGYMIKEDGTN